MGRAVEPFYYDEALAQRAVDFARECVVFGSGDVKGGPFDPMPWFERDVLRPLEGWRWHDGTRRYKYVYLCVPRGNAKSENGSFLAINSLFNGGAEDPQVILAAAAEHQAKGILFESCKNMVEGSAMLSNAAVPYMKSIVRNRGGALQVVAADGRNQHGLRPTAIIVDELHAHATDRLFEALETSMAKRPGCTMVILTTAPEDLEGHTACSRMHRYAKDVVSGKIEDPRFLGVIYEEPDYSCDIEDEACWERANPGLDITIQRDDLRAAARIAKASPVGTASFRRLHLNQTVGGAKTWLAQPIISACEAPQPIQLPDYRRKLCYAGLDLANKIDNAVMRLLFDDNTTIGRYWCPASRIAERSAQDRVPYATWAAEGHIHPCGRNSLDYQQIYEDILELADTYNIREVGYDPKEAAMLVSMLTDAGLNMVEVPQNPARMSEPYKELQALIVERMLRYHEPVLPWELGNVVIKQDPAGHIMVVKGRCPDKVDGVVALGCAIHCRLNDPREAVVPVNFAVADSSGGGPSSRFFT